MPDALFISLFAALLGAWLIDMIGEWRGWRRRALPVAVGAVRVMMLLFGVVLLVSGIVRRDGRAALLGAAIFVLVLVLLATGTLSRRLEEQTDEYQRRRSS